MVILKIFEKYFIFFGWRFWFFLKIPTFFGGNRKSSKYFRRIENEKSRDFSEIFQKFSNFHPKKWKCFPKIFKIFKNIFWSKSWEKLRTISENLFIQSPAMNFHFSARHIENTPLFFRIFKGFSIVRWEIVCLEEIGGKSRFLETYPWFFWRFPKHY